MAVTQIQMGRRSAGGSQISDFLIGLMSIEERREYTAAMKERSGVAREQLGMAQEEFAATKPQREEAAFVSKERLGMLKGTLLLDREIAKTQRAYDVSKQAGNVSEQALTARHLSTLKKSKKYAPITTEWGFFQKEQSARATAENKALMGQVYELNAAYKNIESQLSLVERQRAAKDAMRGNILSTLSTFGKGASAADAVLAMRSVEAGDMAGASNILQRLSTGAAVGENVFEFSKLTSDDQVRYSQKTQGMLMAMETRGISQNLLPEMRLVTKDVQWPRANISEIMTRTEAESRGLIDEWNLASKIDPTKYVDKDKTKTVKELADEKAKKTKPAGGKAAKKPTGKETKGGFTVGQIINRAGKRYKITGFDTDGEPLVVEVK